MGSTLDPDETPQPANGGGPATGVLGPSDSSDSGSDVAGAKRHAFDVDSELDNHALEAGEEQSESDTDRAGTGERASADGDATRRSDADIEPDRIEDTLIDEDEGARTPTPDSVLRPD